MREAKFDAAKIAQYCRENTIGDAMLAFGCSRATVTNACEAHGVALLNKSAAERRKVAEWVKENNASISEATFKFGMTRNRVGSACKENGVTPKEEISDYKPPIARSTLEVLCMLLQGYQAAEIAKAFAVSRQRVSHIKQQAIEARILGDEALIVCTPKVNNESEQVPNE